MLQAKVCGIRLGKCKDIDDWYEAKTSGYYCTDFFPATAWKAFGYPPKTSAIEVDHLIFEPKTGRLQVWRYPDAADDNYKVIVDTHIFKLRWVKALSK